MVSRPFVPQAVVNLAHARRDARLRREWAEADGYRAEIEAAGWVEVDRGVDFDLRPARPADIVEDGEVRYGSSESVPSLLDEPDSVAATIVAVGEGDSASRSVIDGGTGVAVVIVVNGPGARGGPGLATAGSSAEVVRLATTGTIGTARNAGIRRATGSVVVLADPAVAPGPDLVRDLVEALSDPAVAVAGTIGLVSTGLPRFVVSRERDVDAVTGTIAFRRSDYRAHGPFDERFQVAGELDAWWSLVLRDRDEEPPGRAVRVGDLATDGGGTSVGATVAAAATADVPGRRRDRYRILDRFGGRVDLLSSTGADHPDA